MVGRRRRDHSSIFLVLYLVQVSLRVRWRFKMDMHSYISKWNVKWWTIVENYFYYHIFLPLLSIINASIQAAIKLRPVTWLISYRFEEVISMCIKSRPRKQGCASSYRYLKIPRGEKQWPIDHTFSNPKWSRTLLPSFSLPWSFWQETFRVSESNNINMCREININFVCIMRWALLWNVFSQAHFMNPTTG